MDELTSALELLSSAQPGTTRREVFKAPDFTGDSNMEDFIQQFQEVAMASEWSNMATLLYIRVHMKDDARECESHATLKKVLEALDSKYGLTVQEARAHLTSLTRDTKRSLTDHATKVKRLMETAHATCHGHTNRR